MKPIPSDWPVQPLTSDDYPRARSPATCGTCGRTWDDGIATAMTPVPGPRCPFEAFHEPATEYDTYTIQVALPSADFSKAGVTLTEKEFTAALQRGFPLVRMSGIAARVLSSGNPHDATLGHIGAALEEWEAYLMDHDKDTSLNPVILSLRAALLVMQGEGAHDGDD